MKRLLLSTLVAVIGLSISAYAQEIKVYLDGEELTLSTSPIIEEGTSLVPFRGIFEALGLEVGWDAETQTVTGSNSNTVIEFNIGDGFAFVNGEKKELAVPSKVVGGNTMVPLRFVAESVGETVNWNSTTKAIYIGDVYVETIKIPERQTSQEDTSYLSRLAEQEVLERYTSTNINFDRTTNDTTTRTMDIDGVNNHDAAESEAIEEKKPLDGKDWISEDSLKNNYGISTSWMGSKIYVSYIKNQEQKEFYIKNSPSSKFVAGNIYEDGVFRFKYEDGSIYYQLQGFMDKGILE